MEFVEGYSQDKEKRKANSKKDEKFKDEMNTYKDNKYTIHKSIHSLLTQFKQKKSINDDQWMNECFSQHNLVTIQVHRKILIKIKLKKTTQRTKPIKNKARSSFTEEMIIQVKLRPSKGKPRNKEYLDESSKMWCF